MFNKTAFDSFPKYIDLFVPQFLGPKPQAEEEIGNIPNQSSTHHSHVKDV